MLYNWIFTVSKGYTMALLQVLFDLCALDIRIDETSMTECRIECKAQGLDDLCDRIEFYGNMPNEYFAFDACCSVNGVTNYYRIANYQAYTDEITRLIWVDA